MHSTPAEIKINANIAENKIKEGMYHSYKSKSQNCKDFTSF